MLQFKHDDAENGTSLLTNFTSNPCFPKLHGPAQALRVLFMRSEITSSGVFHIKTSLESCPQTILCSMGMKKSTFR